MENILIKETNNTPAVSFNTNGTLSLEGAAMPENSVEFFTPLWNWVAEYSNAKITLNVKLAYFNTSVSKCLLELFKKLEGNTKIQEISIVWYHDKDDEESLESGQMYASISKRAKFSFVSF